MSSPVEKIKSKLGIVEVVGSYLKLEKAGANWRACCPFHNEKTASFFVSPSRESYHCFGCNRGGDIISFVQEIEGLDFIGALKLLADKAGVELKPIDPKEKSESEIASKIIELAVEFFSDNLKNNKSVLDYLYKRGLKDESIQNFRLGFVADEWRSLYDFLIKKGFSEKDIGKVGLIINPSETGGRTSRGYDRFRNRVMFPINNASGNPVGFSGRIFGSGDEKTAKYINSPQTNLYDKSKILYGYDRAKVEIRKKNFCVLVEGQFDLVMSHQSGVINTVGVSGTALTEEHLGMIKRLTDNLVLAYDYDLAGLKASWRAINLARSMDLIVKIAKLPSGQDPADVILNDEKVWHKAISEARHYIDFMIDALMQEGKKGLDLTLAINEYVLPYIKALDKKMEQAHFVSKLSGVLNLPEQSIWDDLNKIKVDNLPIASIQSEKMTDDVSKLKSRRSIIEERLFSLWFLLSEQKLVSDELTKKMEELSRLLEKENFDNKIRELEIDRGRLVMEAEISYGRQKPDLDKEFDELYKNLQGEILREKQEKLMTEIKMSNDKPEQLTSLLKEYQELSNKINELKI